MHSLTVCQIAFNRTPISSLIKLGAPLIKRSVTFSILRKQYSLIALMKLCVRGPKNILHCAVRRMVQDDDYMCWLYIWVTKSLKI